MAGRFERIAGAPLRQIVPRTTCEITGSWALPATRDYDPAPSAVGSTTSRGNQQMRRPIMRYAANGTCGDVTATTVPADPALIRAWPVTVISGLAEPAGCHSRGPHPGSRVAARRSKRNGDDLPPSTTGTRRN